MTIRQARRNEISLLQKLNDEVFAGAKGFDDDQIENWTYSENGKNYYAKLLKNPDVCCLIAEDGGNAIGYVAASPKVDIYRKSKILELENIGVIPKYRSKGVGAEMVQKLFVWAKEKGFQKVYTAAYFGNTKAIGFYKKSGFKEIDL